MCVYVHACLCVYMCTCVHVCVCVCVVCVCVCVCVRACVSVHISVCALSLVWSPSLLSSPLSLPHSPTPTSLVQIELADPTQKILDLGTLKVGDEQAKKSVSLINRSSIPVTFAVSLVASTSSPQLQNTDILQVTPSKEMTLEGRGGRGKVVVTFEPKTRIPRFQEEVRERGRGGEGGREGGRRGREGREGGEWYSGVFW